MTPARLCLAALAAAAVAAGPGALGGEEAALTPASRLLPFVENHSLAGAVCLVASRDRVLSLEAVGYADVAARRPMTTDALFWIASMSKPIAATAFMMLVDEGKVKVDDPVAKYLPDLGTPWVAVEKDAGHELLKPPRHPVTLRQLLTHTSGMVDKTPLERRFDTLALTDEVLLYSLLPLEFEPGTRYRYSSAEVNTVARVIEVVSGLSYPEFLQRRLFAPLGMTDTTFWPTPAQVRRLARAYQTSADGRSEEEIPIEFLTYPLENRGRHPFAGGGLFSTAPDLATFCQMILNGGVAGGRRYLSDKSLHEMTSTQTGDLVVTMPSRFSGDSVSGYGYCWETTRLWPDARYPDDGGSFGHGGTYGTHMQIYPRQGLITIFLNQRGGGNTASGRQIRNTFSDAVAAAYWPK